MNAIILAAGAGRRLAEMGWTKPKCLLPVGSHTLLDRALSVFQASGINDITIVVGYEQELVIAAANEWHQKSKISDSKSDISNLKSQISNPKSQITIPTSQISNLKSHISYLKSQISNFKSQISNLKFASSRTIINFIFNPHFAITNTLYSLWLARENFTGDTILLNGDLRFDPRILDLITRDNVSSLAISVHPCGPEEVKVVTDHAGRIIRIGKDIPVQKAAGESIGLVRLTAPAADALRHSLERHVAIGPFAQPTSPSTNTSAPPENAALLEKRSVLHPSPSEGESSFSPLSLAGRGQGEGRANQGNQPHLHPSAQLFYESALNDILTDQIIIAANIGDLAAVEIDTPEDYERAKGIVGQLP